MKKKVILLVILLAVVMMILTGCMPNEDISRPAKAAGFFSGIWHGWIAPISLIVGVFNGDIRIYEINNTGWWYDFGFYMAIISGFGGLSLFRRKRSHKKDND